MEYQLNTYPPYVKFECYFSVLSQVKMYDIE